MATEHTRERDPLTPLRDGEFWRIPGIGPGIAQRLRAAGIQTFRQLATMTSEEICAQLAGIVGMTSQRIATQDWPGKAEQLAKEIAEAGPLFEPEDPGKRQHYASFMVELLQDENYSVRRTRVVHIQNGEKESWAGWDIGRLDRWIADQAMIKAADRPAAEGEARLPIQTIALEAGGSEVFLPGEEASNRFLVEGQAFTICLPLKIQTTSLPSATLRYQATVQSRSITGQRIQTLEFSGQVTPQEDLVLSIPVDGLKEGAYRLETSLLVYPEDAAQPEKEGSLAFSESGLIYVYSPETEAAA